MNAVRSKKTAEEYLSWAGWFANPTEEATICSRQPAWWQREREIIRQAVREDRVATPEDLAASGQLPPATSLTLTLDADLSLASLSTECASITPDVLARLDGELRREILLERCTFLGEGQRLLVRRPDHGLYAFLWAIARARKYAMSSIPLGYVLDLEDGIFQVAGTLARVDVRIESPLMVLLDRKAAMLLDCLSPDFPVTVRT